MWLQYTSKYTRVSFRFNIFQNVQNANVMNTRQNPCLVENLYCPMRNQANDLTYFTPFSSVSTVDFEQVMSASYLLAIYEISDWVDI